MYGSQSRSNCGMSGNPRSRSVSASSSASSLSTRICGSSLSTLVRVPLSHRSPPRAQELTLRDHQECCSAANEWLSEAWISLSEMPRSGLETLASYPIAFLVQIMTVVNSCGEHLVRIGTDPDTDDALFGLVVPALLPLLPGPAFEFPRLSTRTRPSVSFTEPFVIRKPQGHALTAAMPF